MWALLAPAWTAAVEIHRLEVARDGGLFQLQLDAHLAAPPEMVWATLTDYPNLHRLSRAVQLSEELGTDPDGSHRVRTLSHVCVWIFCRDLEHVQRFRHSGPRRLEADSVPELSDFAFGFTRWSLLPENGGTRLELTSRLRPAFWVPPLLGPLLIQRGLRSTTLDALRGLEREAGPRPRSMSRR